MTLYHIRFEDCLILAADVVTAVEFEVDVVVLVVDVVGVVVVVVVWLLVQAVEEKFAWVEVGNLWLSYLWL